MSDRIVKLREQVPALFQKVNGRDLIYFDNAATAHKPQSVIDIINKMNSGVNSNVHRAVHHLSAEATDLYEESRESVRKFIRAGKREEIIFTSGTTASINLVAYSFGQRYIKEGDVILISESEHHSNIVPWQMLAERTGAELRAFRVDEDGVWDWGSLKESIDERVKIISVAHISNVLGIVNPIKELITYAHTLDIPVLIDGAQSVVHENIDVSDLDCDFFVMSGHKIYAATGTGILYGKEKWLEEMPPFMGGGDMIETVTFNKTTYNTLPLKFEAGTPNFIGAASFTPALKYAELTKDEETCEYQKDITNYLKESLLEVEGLKLYGLGDRMFNQTHKISLFSFTVDGAHHSDLAQLLDKMGIAVRSGQLCAEPLMTRYGETGMLRASLAPYNTMEEAEIFMESLNKAINMLR